jgi:phospholipase A1
MTLRHDGLPGRGAMKLRRLYLLGSVLFLVIGLLQIADRAAAVEEGGAAVAATAEETESAIEARGKLERHVAGNRFAILPHKQNYLLPVSYNFSPNRRDSQRLGGDISRTEVKFQISLKTPLWEEIFAKNGTLFAGYSQLSFWQAYNSIRSSPFRETNYEPELFLSFDTDLNFLGVRNRIISLGVVHQSNGQNESFSRSWNRLYALLAFERGKLYFALKPWYRIPESRATDDNPDIDTYLGYGEFYAVYSWRTQWLGLMLRNNLRTDNRGAIQIDYSFPLLKKMDGYLQFFNGYGESLSDYNESVSRIGCGVIIANWL